MIYANRPSAKLQTWIIARLTA